MSVSNPFLPEEDNRHALKPGEHEAFYFLFTTPDGSLFGFLRTLFDREAVLEMIALRAGGHTWSHRQRVPLRRMEPHEASGPSLGLTCLVPWRSWRCRFHGSTGGAASGVELELAFEATTDPARYRFGPYQQVHQDGRFNGRVRVGTGTWEGEFLGYRDHSWGVRPMGAASGWAVVDVPGRLYVAVVETAQGPFSFGRFISPEGSSVSIQTARIADGGEEVRVEVPDVGVWRARRMVPPLVAHLGPAGQEDLREEPRPGDLLRDEIGPALCTSPDGEEFVGFLEQARRLE